jgi:apolipoprotein N-acyltransferase
VKLRPDWRALGLAVASGLAMALALPLAIPWLSLSEVDPAGHLEWLAWVALVPALFALDRARSFRAAVGLGLVSGLAYFYAAIWWVNHAMTSFGGIPFAAALGALSLLVLYMAAHWALALALGWLVRRRLGVPWVACLPALWVAFEWLRNSLFSGFPWANLGYTQARHLPVAQLAAATGVYGVAALVVLVNAAVHAIARARLDGARFPARIVAATAALLAAVVAYGYAHLDATRARMAAAPRLTVGLVQGNIDQSVKNRRLENAQFILGRFVPLTLEAERRGADLVAWPEATFPWSVPPAIPSFAGAGLPRLERAHLLVGAGTWQAAPGAQARRGDGIASNSVFLLDPALRVLGRYAKHHLVPFGEYVPDWIPFVREVVPVVGRQVPGGELRVLSFTPARAVASASVAAPAGDAVHLAPLICFDAIFPEITRAFSRKDPEPDLLLNPTNDAWYGYSSGPYQFLSIVRMRAIESGKAVARPAFSGVTAVVWPTGEIAPGALPLGPVDPELAPDPDEPPRLLLTEVPRLRGMTLYTRVGDLFAGAATAFAVAAVGLALRRRRA